MNTEIFTNLQNLIGQESLIKRHKASVIIVGLGGIGSWAAEALIRSGIGKMTLVDLDDICSSNTNRQLHTMSSTTGMSKVLTMQKRLKDINPQAEIVAIQEYLTTENLAEIISSHSFIIDAIDSLKMKCELIAFCHKNKIPLVVTGGAAGKSNPEFITIKDMCEAYNDSLLQRARKKLRSDHDFPKGKKQKFKIKTVFSSELMKTSMTNEEIEQELYCDPNALKKNCSNGLGTCVTVTASFGFLAAHQILKFIEESSL